MDRPALQYEICYYAPQAPTVLVGASLLGCLCRITELAQGAGYSGEMVGLIATRRELLDYWRGRALIRASGR